MGKTLLVGGLEHEFHDFPDIGNFIIPTDFHSIIFQRGRYTTNQIMDILRRFVFRIIELSGIFQLWITRRP